MASRISYAHEGFSGESRIATSSNQGRRSMALFSGKVKPIT